MSTGAWMSRGGGLLSGILVRMLGRNRGRRVAQEKRFGAHRCASSGSGCLHVC